jgi:hypothetical protein
MSDDDESSITDLVNGFLTEQREQHASASGRLTFASSVRAFIVSSSWLGPEHMPSVVALVELADRLDLEVTAAMVGQFGVTFRDLRSQAPGSTPPPSDPVEEALRAAGK